MDRMTTLWPTTIPEGLQNTWEHLVWARDCAVEVRAHLASPEQEFDAQRFFFYALMHFDIARKQLIKSAEFFDRRDIAEHLHAASKKDPLLHYYRHARNATTHHFLRFSRTVSLIGIAIVNLPKALRYRENLDDHAWRTKLLCTAFGVSSYKEAVEAVERGEAPTREKLADLGIDFKVELHTDLVPFTYVDGTNRGKPITRSIAAPRMHLGTLTIGSAEETIGLVGRFYTHYLHVLAVVARCAPDETCMPFPRADLARMRELKPPRSHPGDSLASPPR